MLGFTSIRPFCCCDACVRSHCRNFRRSSSYVDIACIRATLSAARVDLGYLLCTLSSIIRPAIVMVKPNRAKHMRSPFLWPRLSQTESLRCYAHFTSQMEKLEWRSAFMYLRVFVALAGFGVVLWQLKNPITELILAASR